MDAWTIIRCLALVLAPMVFGVITIREALRLRRLLRHGISVEGEVIGEELHGIRYRAPYPVVQFRAADGSIRQFRSLISRRNRAFVHSEKVIVRYLPESPERAELFSGFHPYKHLAGIVIVLTLTAVFAVYGLPIVLAQ